MASIGTRSFNNSRTALNIKNKRLYLILGLYGFFQVTFQIHGQFRSRTHILPELNTQGIAIGSQTPIHRRLSVIELHSGKMMGSTGARDATTGADGCHYYRFLPL